MTEDPHWNPWFKTGIVVIPTQGLGNRLRMMADAWVLARLWKLSFEVVWTRSQECNCEFADLFANDAFTTCTQEDVAARNYLFRGPAVHTQSLLAELLQHTNAQPAHATLGSSPPTWDYLVLMGGHEFVHPWVDLRTFRQMKREFHRQLSWSDRVKNQVLELTNHAPALRHPYTAVHFRDFDQPYDAADAQHQDQLGERLFNPARFNVNSPPEAFVKALIQALRLPAAVVPRQVLVVSNNPRAQEMFSGAVENATVMPPLPAAQRTGAADTRRDRHSSQGMVEAAAEFVLLSRAAFIVGSFYSSFSDEASASALTPKICPLSTDLQVRFSKLDAHTLAGLYHCAGFERGRLADAEDDCYGLNMDNLDNPAMRQDLQAQGQQP